MDPIAKIATRVRRVLEPFDRDTLSVPVAVADNARMALNRAAYPQEYGHLAPADRRTLAELDEAIYEAMAS